jgi:preprotein translocase subunit SecD
MGPKRISIIASSVAAFVVVALIAILVHGAQGLGSASRPGTGTESPFQQQWSQRGGIQFLLTVATGPDSQAMSADVLTIKRRLATLVSQSDTQVYVHHLANGRPSNIIVVEVAGHTTDEASIASLLATTGQLDIIDTGSTPLDTGADVTGQTCATSCAPGQYKVVFTGGELDPNSISATLDPSSNLPVIQLAFQRAAQSAFAAYTQGNIGNYLTITLDNKVIESATIQSQISGPFEISGITTLAQAQDLATLLKYGPLSAPVIASTHQIIQPGTPLPTTSCQTATAPPSQSIQCSGRLVA